MDYESIYHKMTGGLRMFRGFAKFDKDYSDKTNQDNVRLPIMANMYWSMAYEDKYFHIPEFDAFVSRYQKEAMALNAPFMDSALQCYQIEKDDPYALYKMERCFASRAKKAFPSFTRDQAMITRLGDPRYGKLRILYDSALDTMWKIDAVVIFEDGGVCGLGFFLNTPDGRAKYETHLARLAKWGRGHGNLPVHKVEIGETCAFNGRSFPCDKDELERTNLFLPMEAFVDCLMEEIRKLPRPSLEDLTSTGVMGPKESIEKVSAGQETRWPSVILRGLRALTS